MTDIFKPINDDRNGASGTTSEPYASKAASSIPPSAAASAGVGRTAVAGLVGGVLSAAGYFVYTRLPDDQKDRLHQQVRTLVESRVNELRGRFNI